MKRANGRVGITAVAKKSGVSPSTVSRVMNSSQNVSEEIRQRVLAATEDLGYVPLRKTRPRRQYGTLLVLLPSSTNPYFHEMVIGIRERAAQITESVVTVIDMEGFFESHDFDRFCGFVRASNPSGLIVFSNSLSDHQIRVLRVTTEIPIVLFDHWVDEPGIFAVKINYVMAMSQVTHHLLKLGHRRIAHLVGRPDLSSSREKREGITLSVEGFDEAVSLEHCLATPPAVEWAFQMTSSLLARPLQSRPTAILCDSDMLALGALHAARALQLRVPDDVSVTGFDDVDMAIHANPPLTTISPPKREMGRIAVEMIAGKRSVENQQVYTALESPLIVRESTAPCAEA
ncbi:MAG TPA: LacI family DNA-binding transcriptional regulator [Spirochaetia bacterium]|nr:LacI family DNA-binding transcriptional regulator [Spirochaetia bacterium]